jgi:hypothetical protein
VVRRLRLLVLAGLLAFGFFTLSNEWQANAAMKHELPWLRLDAHERGPAKISANIEQRASDRRAPGPAIDPYVRPEFAAEMRTLRPTILAAARRHNRPELSGMSDHDFAVIIALILYNEHFGWFEERIRPVQALTPLYEDLQRQTNETGISDLSLWPTNIRPSVALEILRKQVPLPHSSQTVTEPITVAGSTIDPSVVSSQQQLYAMITAEITEPDLAVEYLAANLERGLFRAKLEGVTVTWRTLAAWHNQGIVAPEDLRKNPTASDYIRRASAYFGKARALIDTPPPRAPAWQFGLEEYSGADTRR